MASGVPWTSPALVFLHNYLWQAIMCVGLLGNAVSLMVIAYIKVSFSNMHILEHHDYILDPMLLFHIFDRAMLLCQITECFSKKPSIGVPRPSLPAPLGHPPPPRPHPGGPPLPLLHPRRLRAEPGGPHREDGRGRGGAVRYAGAAGTKRN